MTDRTRQQLLGHLLGALDDDEHQALDERLEQDPHLCRELAAWRRRLAPLEAIRPDFEPRPGLAQRVCRLVASYASSASAELAATRHKMSPQPNPPSRATHVGWFDMATVGLLLLTAVAVVFPAIENSRFQSRLASCQNGLRHFGLALMQYSSHQRNELAQLADNESLTNAGLVAASLVRDVYSTGNQPSLCPDAWLAAQRVLCDTPRVETQLASLQTPPIRFPGGQLQNVNDRCDDWSGSSRNGTTAGLRCAPSLAAMPLLADAPSVDVPGQNLASHGGQGRNVFYADGHTDFIPTSASRDVSFSRLSAPIIFVGGR